MIHFENLGDKENPRGKLPQPSQLRGAMYAYDIAHFKIPSWRISHDNIALTMLGMSSNTMGYSYKRFLWPNLCKLCPFLSVVEENVKRYLIYCFNALVKPMKSARLKRDLRTLYF